MEVSNFIVKTGRGKNTKLDKAYTNLLNTVLHTQNEEQLERWETYNLIIKEMLKVDGTQNYFSEIKYRVTDGEDPNYVILDILKKNDNISGLAWQLKRRIDQYIEEDLTNRFY